MIFYVVMLFVFIRREKEGAKPGTGFPLLLAAYGAFRFLEERFRVSGSTSLVHLSHLWSVIAFIVGLSILIEMNSTTKKRRAHAK